MNMKKRFLLPATALAFALSACSSSDGGGNITAAQGSNTPAEQEQPSSTPSVTVVPRDYSLGQAMNARIGRGINFGNAFDATCESCWGGGPIEEHFVSAVAAAGFNSVRLPVRWDTHADNAAPFTIEADYLARVKEVVGWINAAGMVCIINMHHHQSFLDDVVDPYANNRVPNLENAEAHLTRIDAIWNQVATYFADIDNNKLVFELFNEPRDGVSSDLHNQMIARTYPIIRATNPGRTIMYGATTYNAYAGIRSLKLPEDGNIIFTPHYYQPAQYALQGENYNCPEEDKLYVWEGNSDELSKMRADFDNMRALADQYYPGGLPINIGEFGATECGGKASRIKWIKNFVKEANSHGFSYNYWGLVNVGGYEIYDKDTQVWTDPDARDAILNK